MQFFRTENGKKSDSVNHLPSALSKAGRPPGGHRVDLELLERPDGALLRLRGVRDAAAGFAQHLGHGAEPPPNPLSNPLFALFSS